MTTASWVFGSVLVPFLIAFVFWNPATLPGPQQMVVRLLGSVFAGLISAFFVGTMHLQATVRKIQIAAVGGFAAFCLVSFFGSRKTSTTWETHPSPRPSSDAF
jgi:predicted lipid-binding transport protein (Tim44 family)